MNKRKRIAVSIGLATAGFCCMGGMFAWQELFGKVAAQKDFELAKARNAGIPTTPEDLAKLRNVSDKDNAAPLYVRLMAKLAKGTSAAKQMDIVSAGVGSSAKIEQRSAAIRALVPLSPILKDAMIAASLPHCDFHRKWYLGEAQSFGEFFPMRSLARAICLDAEQKSASGDWPTALHELSLAQSIGHHVGEDPIIIAMLIECAIEGLVQASLIRITNEHSHEQKFLEAARQFNDRLGPLPDFRTSLFGEVVGGRMALRNLKSMRDFNASPEEESRPNPFESTFFNSPVVHDAFDAKFVHAYTTMIVAMPKDPNMWESTAKICTDSERQIESDNSLANMVNKVMFPVFSQASQIVGATITRRRLTETTLRLLMSRMKTGSLPLVLPDYGPSRIDPFTGNPFIYHRRNPGFILYSVGQDRKDDGGRPRSEDRGGSGYDEVIQIK